MGVDANSIDSAEQKTDDLQHQGDESASSDIDHRYNSSGSEEPEICYACKSASDRLYKCSTCPRVVHHECSSVPPNETGFVLCPRCAKLRAASGDTSTSSDSNDSDGESDANESNADEVFTPSSPDHSDPDDEDYNPANDGKPKGKATDAPKQGLAALIANIETGQKDDQSFTIGTGGGSRKIGRRIIKARRARALNQMESELPQPTKRRSARFQTTSSAEENN